MQRYELSNTQWEILEPLLPVNHGRKRRWRDHRQIINGMLWILHTSVPRRDLPERYGPWQTVYDRFRRWSADGTFNRIVNALQLKLHQQGRIDPELFIVDATIVRASRAANGTRKKGAQH